MAPPRPGSPAGGNPGAPPAGGAPQAPPPDRPAPPTRRPLITPTQAALFAAGQELSTNDAPTLAHAVSRALAAGVPAFLTSKQAERDQADSDALDAAWRAQVDALQAAGTIEPGMASVARGLTAPEGRRYISEVLAERDKKGAATRNPTHDIIDERTGQILTPGTPEAPPPPPLTATSDIKNFLAQYAPAAALGMTSENFTSWPDSGKTAYHAFLKDFGPKGVNVSQTTVLPSSVDAFTGSSAGAAGTRFDATADKIRSSDDALAALARQRTLLDEPTFVGGLANAKTTASSWAKAFGLDIAADARINTQELRQLTNNTLVTRVKELGVNPSNADLAALREAIGSITDDPKTLARVFDTHERIIRQGQNRYNEDWLRAYDQAKEYGQPLPPNQTPVGDLAQQLLDYAAMPPEVRKRYPNPLTRRP